MENKNVRALEYGAIGRDTDGDISTFDFEGLIKNKVNLEGDGVFPAFRKDWNSFSSFDIMHIPAAIGVLIARLIYPSIGVMDYAARLTNLAFFLTSFYFIIKKSKNFKWLLVMLFSVPYFQKLASPSYDLYCFVALALFALNFLELAQLKSFKELTRKKLAYSLLTIVLLFFAKKFYVFGVVSFIGLPMIYLPVWNYFKQMKKWLQALAIILVSLISLGIIAILHQKFDLLHFSKVFFDSYLNAETMGNNAKRMWTIMPSILPQFFNILWLILLVIVELTELKVSYQKWTVFVSSFVYLINWVGIFAGFYMMRDLKHTPETLTIDPLSGRYLQPFMIFFIPLVSNFSYKHHFEVSEKSIARLVMSLSILILTLYLVMMAYRSYVLQATPIWTNK